MNAISCNAHKSSAVAYVGDQFISCPDGEVLYSGFVHSQVFLYLSKLYIQNYVLS